LFKRRWRYHYRVGEGACCLKPLPSDQLGAAGIGALLLACKAVTRHVRSCHVRVSVRDDLHRSRVARSAAGELEADGTSGWRQKEELSVRRGVARRSTGDGKTACSCPSVPSACAWSWRMSARRANSPESSDATLSPATTATHSQPSLSTMLFAWSSIEMGDAPPVSMVRTTCAYICSVKGRGDRPLARCAGCGDARNGGLAAAAEARSLLPNGALP